MQSDALLRLSTVLIAPTSTAARAASLRPEIDIDGDRRVVDLSFSSTPVEAQLRQAAASTGAAFEWHPGTAIAPRELASHPTAVAWVDDDAYLARLVEELERLAAPASLADAASTGRLVADTRPGPPSLGGGDARSPLQRVKHSWRLTYLL